MELDAKKVDNWLMHFKLYPYTQIHSSGHLGYDEIKEFIETVHPKVVIPVHTQNPEVFKNLHSKVIVPEKGVEYTVV
jgi:ribonuclease J